MLRVVLDVLLQQRLVGPEEPPAIDERCRRTGNVEQMTFGDTLADEMFCRLQS